MCFSLSVAPTDKLIPHPLPNPLSETLETPQSVPSFPNINCSSFMEIVPCADAPPPPPASPPAADIYSDIFDKEAPLEDPDPAPPFRLLDDDDLSTPWSPSKDSRSWQSSSSRVSADEEAERASEGNLLCSGDGEAPSANEISASAIVSSRVGAGLENLGNTCFLNAILQCFTHTVPLVQGLRSCSHSSSSDGDCGIDGFCVICALRDHFERSLASSGRNLSPLKLVENLNNFSSFFRRYQQEDAHEFMQCALDKLERCFLDLKRSQSLEDDNLVEKVFGGRLVSKLQCCNCGHSSDTYEPLIDLSLEIEDADTLPSALESFTKVESIDAKFRCDGCKEEVSMEKQLMLDQTPSIAAFHLKRFKTDGIYVEKIDKHVDFPLELDLQPYTISNQNNNVQLLKYELYAVVVHIGSSSTSGHYFCFVRSAPDTWHKLDDAKVTKVSGASVISQEAYILFYARQGTPWFSSIMESLTPCMDTSIMSTSPTSVLDVDNMNKSSPTIPGTVVSGEVCGPQELSEQPFDYYCEEKLEVHDVNDDGDASNGSKQFPSVLNQESGRLNVSKDTNSAQMPLGNNAILRCSDRFDGNSYTESGGIKKNNSCQAVNFADNDGFHPLTPPSSPSPDPPARIYHIPRDHLKMENRGSCKRSLNKKMVGDGREEALRYVSKMRGSKRNVLLDLFYKSDGDASSNKKMKKIDSRRCKKSSAQSVPPKSNHASVMRPAGISR